MDDLIKMTDAVVSPLENQINQLNKKAAGAAWGWFKRALGTASEPFLRKDMGERYFTAEAYASGAGLWLLGGLFGSVFPLRSMLAGACFAADLSQVGGFLNNPVISIMAGFTMFVLHLVWGGQSIGLMKTYRNEGRAYHTMSRGVSRWGDKQALATVLIPAILFVTNIPLGVLFLVAYGMSAKLAGEQQAAIYSRYLDALDQKIEQEYMENAILGKCPTEITYLCKPLDANLNGDLRNNIAAAAVGKPVKIVAKAPNMQG